jgi:hypothetical protein
MRHIATLLLLLIAFSGATAQNLADTYKAGTVTLQEDSQYGAATDWKQVFSIPAVDTDDGKVEPYKSLVVAGDGTATPSRSSIRRGSS